MQEEIYNDTIKEDTFQKTRTDIIKNEGTPADMKEKEKEIKLKNFDLI